MKLLVFSGLPGTGKSTLAESVGRKFGIPVFAKDWLEATLAGCEFIQTNDEKLLGSVGYRLLTMLAERQLMLEQSVILDSCASTESIRLTWKQLATKYKADWKVVECICSDVCVHHTQLKTRQRHIPGWHELEWADVELVRSYYAPWNEPRIRIDSVAPLDENLEKVFEWLEMGKENNQ